MTGGEGSKRQRRGDESRLALLEAGVELLQEQNLDTILSARAVARQAQRSSGSFFYYWETTDEYLSDLLDHVLRPGSVPQVEEMGSMLDHLAREDARPVDLIRAICEQDFVNTINDPLLPVEMLLWSHHNDPRVRKALARFYDWTDEVGVSRFELTIQSWKRRARPPLELETLPVILTAVLEGLAIRHVIQPDLVPRQLFGEIVLALLPALLSAETDSETLDELANASNAYVES